MKLTDKEYYRLLLYIRKKYGINLAGKKNRIEKLLGSNQKLRDFSSFDSYMQLIETDQEPILSNELISLFTTNYTCFLREISHLEYLQNEILKSIHNRTEEFRIWSAAVSTGEEIYSIYMFIQDYYNTTNSKLPNIKLEASDISREMLKIAKEGVYEEEKLSKIPEEWKVKYFLKRNNGAYKISQSITNDILWSQINLIERLQDEERYDVIFLKNVLSYFDSYVTDQVVDNIVKTLKVSGYLFLGEKEKILLKNKNLNYLGNSTYQKI